MVYKKKRDGRVTGNISVKEGKKIAELHGRGLDVAAIAAELNRRPQAIKNYLGRNENKDDKLEEQRRILKAKLRGREYWKDINAQFTSDEMGYFAETWIDLFLQFKEDILSSEELQIKQLITVEILINRCLKERKVNLEEIEKLENEFNNLRDSDANPDMIVNISQQISMMRNSASAYTTEYTKLVEKSREISKDLKATRDSRIKKTEDARGNFLSLLKQLEDEDERERMGYEGELMKKAQKNAYDKLSKAHKYVDGKYDQPILTADNLIEE